MPQKNTPALIRTLSDLLQLEQDALRSYPIAIDALENEGLKEQLRVYRRDHQRQVKRLSLLIEENGGAPLKIPHLSTGMLKLAMQSLGAAGGDRAILLAFRTNEWESMDKYARAARRRYGPDVSRVIRQGAEAEAKHYRWVVESLERLGAGDRTVLGRVEKVLERLNGAAVRGLEGLEQLGVGMISSRRGASSSEGSRVKTSSNRRAKKD